MLACLFGRNSFTSTLCSIPSFLVIILYLFLCLIFFFFFFQAEDGIRDVAVTGVQTCALPIYLPPHLAVLGHESLHLRVREGVVLGDDHHPLVALRLVGVAAEADHPLGALGVEAEEVRRRADQRGALGPRRAVDKGDAGLGLGVVLDRDALRAGERAHHDLDLVLLDQLA